MEERVFTSLHLPLAGWQARKYQTRLRREMKNLNYQPEPVYSKHEEMTKRQKFSQVDEITFLPTTSTFGS